MLVIISRSDRGVDPSERSCHIDVNSCVTSVSIGCIDIYVGM
jgi:hypothetical protein